MVFVTVLSAAIDVQFYPMSNSHDQSLPQESRSECEANKTYRTGHGNSIAILAKVYPKSKSNIGLSDSNLHWFELEIPRKLTNHIVKEYI